MKARILTLTTILCLGIIFQGCEKEADINKASFSKNNKKSHYIEHDKSLDQTYTPEEIGEFHNYVLEMVYNGSVSNTNLNNTQVVDLGLQILENEITTATGLSSYEYYSFLSSINLPTTIDSTTNMNTVIASMQNYSIIEAYKSDHQLGEDIEYYFNNILIEDDETIFFQKLNNFKQSYIGQPYQDMVSTIVEVTEHSYQYWEANLDDWNNDDAMISDKAKRILTADGSGAVTGLISGLIGSGGNPIGGLLGVMIGAPYSSATAGLLDACGWWD